MKKTNRLLLVLFALFTVCFYSCEELFGIEEEEDAIINSTVCTGYVGPSNIDQQYDYQCQAAYAYKCNGEEDALRKQCAYYKELQRQLDLPDCDYCD